MQHLFTPFTLRKVEFRNRIGVSPMCQYSAVDGFVSAWHLVHLGARASGGAGLVIVEATAVEPEGRISPRDLGLWMDDHVEPLRQITGFMKSQGAVPGIQIAHAGRKASTSPPWEGSNPVSLDNDGWIPKAPSSLAWDEGFTVPEELSIEEIHSIQKKFGQAAARADKAGFDFLEIHAAHGYLAHSFLSPLTNKRTDEYGGELENRMRFVIETVQEVRKYWPESKPLCIRLSCSDWVENGWTIKDSVELASRLKWEGIDLIDCSSGGIKPGVKYPAGASWQVPFAAEIKHKSSVATAAVGMIIEPMQADAVIRNDRVDMVLLGREMLRDPYWPYHAAQTLNKGHLLKMPVQYDYVIGSQ